MKKLFLTLTMSAGLALLGFTGCSKSESGATTLDTAKLQSAFATAATVDKAAVDKAVTAIKAADYPAAIASLNQAAANVKLTPDQQQAVKDMLASVQAKLSAAAGEAAKQAGDALNKAAGDLQKKKP